MNLSVEIVFGRRIYMITFKNKTPRLDFPKKKNACPVLEQDFLTPLKTKINMNQNDEKRRE